MHSALLNVVEMSCLTFTLVQATLSIPAVFGNVSSRFLLLLCSSHPLGLVCV